MWSRVFSVWCLVLCLRPFISGSVTPNISLAIQCTLLALGLVLWLRAPRPIPAFTSLSASVAAFTAAGLLALIWSPDKARAVSVWFDLVSPAIAYPVLQRATDLQKRLLMRGLLFGGLLISAFALLQIFSLFPALREVRDPSVPLSPLQDIASMYRPLGTFPVPNFLAGYLGILLIAAASLLKDAKGDARKSLFVITCLFAMGLVFLMAQSLGATLALAAACLIALVTGRKQGLRRWWILAASSVLLVAGLLVTPPMLGEYANVHNPFRNRLTYWKVTESVIRDHPVLGSGLGSFKERYDALRPPEAPRVTHAHNGFLELWAETGLVILLPLLWLIRETLKRASHHSAWLLAAGLVFVLHNLVETTLYVPQINFLWWCIAGLAARPRSPSP